MKDLDIIAHTIKNALFDIAKQAATLGNGLQNVAPGDKSGLPNNSVQYLLSIAEALMLIGEAVEKLLSFSSKNDTNAPTPRV